MHQSITNVALFVALVGLLAFAGCSSGNNLGTTVVTGTVTVDGTATEGIAVSFIPTEADGRECYGVTDAKGKFTLTVPGADVGSGAMPGEYRAMFSKTSNPTDGMSDEEIAQKFPRGLPPAENLLPTKYADRTATDIEPVNVVKGKKNDFTFELKSQ